MDSNFNITKFYKRAITFTYLLASLVLVYSIYNWYQEGPSLIVVISIVVDLFIFISLTIQLRKFLKIRKELKEN